MKKTALYLILLIIDILQPCVAQNRVIDSLLSLIKIDKEDTNKAIHLYKLSGKYYVHGDYDKGSVYGKQALDLSETLNFNKGVASSKNTMGLIYWKLGNYPEALKSFFTSLKIREETNDYLGAARTYNNLGLVYNDQENYSEALKNYSAALKLFQQLNDKDGIATSYNNMGEVFKQQKLDAKALENHFKSLKIRIETNDKDGIAYSYNNIGQSYMYLGNYKEALKNTMASMKLREELQDKEGLAISYLTLGTLYTFLHKEKEARNYLNKALLLSKEIGYKETTKNTYRSLATLDSLSGNFNAAFEHHKLYYLYSDSLINAEAKNKSLQVSMQYEFDKKEVATKFENDKVVLKLEDENKLHKQQRLFLVGFIALALILLFFAKRAYDTKKKYAEVVSKENEHKEILLQEVHHRVNNSLQMISSLLSLQADNTTNSEVKEYLIKSENRVHAMSAMHELLHEGNTQLQVDISKYLNRVLDFYKKVLETKPNIKLDADIPTVTFHSKIALPLALIVNELVTNAIKYAFPNDKDGVIHISLATMKENANQWVLKISDNGVGLPEEKNAIRENSLGLRLVNIMTKQIGGTLNIATQNGTCFEIVFTSI